MGAGAAATQFNLLDKAKAKWDRHKQKQRDKAQQKEQQRQQAEIRAELEAGRAQAAAWRQEFAGNAIQFSRDLVMADIDALFDEYAR